MTEKCAERCPFCADDVARYGEVYHKVYSVLDGKYAGLPRCERCGCVYVDGQWIFECQQCGARVDELYGLFVPYLCRKCHDALVERQRRHGQVCGKCRAVRAMCCC